MPLILAAAAAFVLTSPTPQTPVFPKDATTMTETLISATENDSCTITLPDALANLALATSENANHTQIMHRDNVVFTDATPDAQFTYSYQDTLTQLSNCKVTQTTTRNDAGDLVYELDIQGKMPGEGDAAPAAFQQNNLYILSGDDTVLREYFFIGSALDVASQIKDRDASLNIADNPIDAGLIVWDAITAN